jgi:hypothetical protein
MLVAKPFNNVAEYLNVLRGEESARGVILTNTAGSPNVTTTGNGFADVEEGDEFHISGETTVFTVDTKTNANALILSDNVVAAHTADGVWRSYRGGIGFANMLDRLDSPTQFGAGYIIYDDITFTS